MPKISKKHKDMQIEITCRQAFNYLNTIGKIEWDIEDRYTPDRQQVVSMVFYALVYKFGSEESGWEDIDCRGTSIKTTNDHCFAPRMGCRTIMNGDRKILDDYEEFKKFFMFCRTTVKVVKKSNDTSDNKFQNKGGVITVKSLTENKYKPEAGLVRLWIRKGSSNPIDPKEGFPLAHLIPDSFKKEERKYYNGSEASLEEHMTGEQLEDLDNTALSEQSYECN